MKERSVSRCKRFFGILAALSMVLVLLTSTFAMAESVPAGGSDGLTVKISGSAQGSSFGAAASILESGSIDIRYGASEDGALLNAGVSLGGQDFLSLLLKATQDKIALQIPQAGEEVYEITTQKAAECVMQLLSQIEGVSGVAADPQALIPQISEELVSEALMPVLEAFSEHITANTTTGTGAISLEKLGRSIENGTIFTYKPTAAEIETFLNKLGDIAQSNEALGTLVKEFAEYMRGLEGLATFTTTIGGSSEEMSALEAADELEQFYADLPQLLHESSAEIGQMLEAMDATVTVGVTEEGIPALIELRLTQEGQTLRAAFELDVTDAGASYYLDLQVDDEEFAIFGDLAMDGTRLTGHFTVYTSADGPVFEASCDLDMTKTSLLGINYGTVFMQAMNGFKMDVIVQEGETPGTDRHSISVFGPSSAEQGTDTQDSVTIHIDSSAENTAVEPQGTPVDVSDYTPEQFVELFNQIGEKITTYLNS